MTVANISFMQYQFLPVDVSAEKYSKTMVTGLVMSLEMFHPDVPPKGMTGWSWQGSGRGLKQRRASDRVTCQGWSGPGAPHKPHIKPQSPGLQVSVMLLVPLHTFLAWSASGPEDENKDKITFGP